MFIVMSDTTRSNDADHKGEHSSYEYIKVCTIVVKVVALCILRCLDVYDPQQFLSSLQSESRPNITIRKPLPSSVVLLNYIGAFDLEAELE